MSLVTTTAPDFQLAAADLPRLQADPGSCLQLLVLAARRGQLVAVDLDSGALIRAWCPAVSSARLRPYDLVEATVAADNDAVPDPVEPEALVLDDEPEPFGRLEGRRAERLLRPLLHPDDAPLLGSHAPAIPFWERRDDHPSIALVEPQGPVVLRREPGYLGCRFTWQGKVRQLPCLDERRAAEMDRAGQISAPGPKRARLVVALTPPIDGRCHKVVEVVLPRP